MYVCGSSCLRLTIFVEFLFVVVCFAVVVVDYCCGVLFSYSMIVVFLLVLFVVVSVCL